MDALLDEGLRAAIYFLEKNGEFFPFGVTMSPSCEIIHTQGWTGDEHPPSQEVIDVLLHGFAAGAERGEYKIRQSVMPEMARSTMPVAMRESIDL
ncbi:MAG: hypothetical protein HUU20_08280 [Pirellulales bacterium]|nr:hypothetical protein [Pirellulales bacterium]